MDLLNSPEAALGFLAACAAKATVLLTVAWLVTMALRNQSAAMRHRVWAAGILSSLSLPLLTMVLPRWPSAALGGASGAWSTHTAGTMASFEDLPAMIVNASAASPLSSRWAGTVLAIWIFGLFVVALKLMAGLARLAWMSRQATAQLREGWLRCVAKLCDSYEISREVQVLQCRNPVAMPLTWGFLRPVVLLPGKAEEWPANRARMVLSHELSHIARHDWMLQIAAELARGFYWFHPLSWMAARNLRQESERACDDSVLNGGIEASEYAAELLDLARTLEHPSRHWSTALAIARPSHLESRFIAMLNPSIDRRRLSHRAGILSAVAALGVLLPLAALSLPGQNQWGKLSGTIHDPSGTAVRNATVILTDRKSNTAVMTASDPEGNFRFNALPAGEYEMKVVKRGFETYRSSELALEPGRDLSPNITLDIAAVMEEVDVVPEGTVKPLPESEKGGKPSRLRLGGEVQASKLVNRVMPVYPASAKTAGVQGTVILHAVIGMDGRPLSLRVMNNDIDPELARAAIEAVSQWRYRPTLLNGEPIEIDTTIMVNFSLQS
jgi:TonB family protein